MGGSTEALTRAQVVFDKGQLASADPASTVLLLGGG